MKHTNNDKIFQLPASLINHLNKKEVQIWDVRTPMEFIHGHIDGAINVPYDELDWYMAEALSCKRPIVTCSTDDQRSYLAYKRLKENGVEVIDGGDWEELINIINEKNA